MSGNHRQMTRRSPHMIGKGRPFYSPLFVPVKSGCISRQLGIASSWYVSKRRCRCRHRRFFSLVLIHSPTTVHGRSFFISYQQKNLPMIASIYLRKLGEQATLIIPRTGRTLGTCLSVQQEILYDVRLHFPYSSSRATTIPCGSFKVFPAGGGTSPCNHCSSSVLA